VAVVVVGIHVIFVVFVGVILGVVFVGVGRVVLIVTGAC